MNGPSTPTVRAFVAALALCALTSSASARLPEHFGEPRASLAGLSAPAAVAFAPSGRLLVADTGHDRLVVFEPSGRRLAVWGGRGSAAGEFLRPAGLAVAPDGRVFVADTGNHRIQVLAEDGAPLAVFGTRGPGEGQLCEPRGLAVDATRVLVADSGNERVLVFDHEGHPLAVLRASADEEGALLRPVDVALDASGRAFVVDELACRVELFDAEHRHLGGFGGRGPQYGLLSGPGAVDLLGARVFVADRFNHRVQELDPGGAFRASFPGPAFVPRDTRGKLFAPAGLAVSPDGKLIAVAEPLEDRVQLYGEAPPDSAEHLHPQHSGIEDSLAHVGDGGGAAGRLMAVVDPELRAVDVYDVRYVDPARITRLGALGGTGVTFLAPRDAAVDLARGWIHVSDPAAGRLHAFRLQRSTDDDLSFDAEMGRLVRSIDFARVPRVEALATLDWRVQPGALACAADGGLFVADERNGAVIALDARGRVTAAWGREAPRPLRRPVDLALSPDGGRLFVADADAACVRIYDLRGRLRGSIGQDGSGPGRLMEPWGLLARDDGSVLVSDRRADCVHVFDAEGRWLKTWGEAGSGAGQMHQPTGLLAGPEGMIYLLDPGNRRGQVLTAQGRFSLTF